jgi:hypothetical protein
MDGRVFLRLSLGKLLLELSLNSKYQQKVLTGENKEMFKSANWSPDSGVLT